MQSGGMGGLFGSIMGGGMGGLGQIFNGLFGNDSAGYDEAAKKLQQYMQQATGAWKPFLESGQNAIDPFQRWGQQYQDPEAFLKDTFSKYNMSPGAQYQMGQAQRAANNAASAGGLSGSTAHMKESANIANKISSQDMQQYLQNILGVGNQYGNSLNTLLGLGTAGAQGTSGALQGMGSQLAQLFGGGAAAQQGQRNQLMSGGLQMLPFLFM
jgi:hypothetical protein